MLKGIHLTLMVGPAVPVPVPRMVLDALTSVEVTNTTSGPSGFSLSFTLTNNSPLQTIFLLAGGAMPPMIRVVLVATINGVPEVLIDGVMTNHQVSPGSQGYSTLKVIGEDLTRVMDYQQLSGIPYPATNSAARVAIILAKYLPLGIIPIVVPPFLSDVENPLDMVPLHQGTDLDYIRCLANVVGHVFYIEPGPTPLTSRAYWGPEVKTGIPQPALNINMDAHTNCESLDFQFNSEGRVMPYVTIHAPFTNLPIPIPIPNDISVLNPPLGLIPPIPKSFYQVEDTAKLSATKALLRGLASASKSADAVTAKGSLDVSRYGRPLKARRLVGVRGAGAAFDGLYYVRSVTHQIQRGSYKQSFELSRNGLVSTVPRVPV
jgi:hypothetical protein